MAKLRSYCLNPRHPRGRHKARVFASALGITRENAGLLRQALLEAAESAEVTLDPTIAIEGRQKKQNTLLAEVL